MWANRNVFPRLTFGHAWKMLEWFLSLLSAEQWEAWRNWLATVGGLIALLIAANTYRHNVRIKLEEQARLVYSKLGQWDLVDVGEPVHSLPGSDSTTWAGIDGQFNSVEPLIHAHVLVSNLSKELIGPVRVRVIDRDLGTYLTEHSAQVDSVVPESVHKVDFTFPNPKHPTPPWIGTEIEFRDASGQWWRRRLAEPVSRLTAKKVQFTYK